MNSILVGTPINLIEEENSKGVNDYPPEWARAYDGQGTPAQPSSELNLCEIQR